tara:strand:+ start:2389 stop:3264 length:876 start_codon:yes stop_codon:yes gene_type:complete
MGFKLRSGNKPNFKMMGSSSPLLKTTDGKKTKEDLLNEGFTQRDADQMIKHGAHTGHIKQKPKKSSVGPKFDASKGWKKGKAYTTDGGVKGHYVTDPNGKKYFMTSSGKLHTGQIDDLKPESPAKFDKKLKDPKNNKKTKKEDRPDPTYEGTDEYRSIDEIREDADKGKKDRKKVVTQDDQPTYEGTDEYRTVDEIREDSERGKKIREDEAKVKEKTKVKEKKSSPTKQKTKPKPKSYKGKMKKVFPKNYTKKDIEFLKKQREDIVRREDLDEKGKKIFDRNQAKIAKKKK